MIFKLYCIKKMDLILIFISKIINIHLHHSVFVYIYFQSIILAYAFIVAVIAQLVEQLICNHQARGSNPRCGTIYLFPSPFSLLIMSYGLSCYLRSFFILSNISKMDYAL